MNIWAADCCADFGGIKLFFIAEESFRLSGRVNKNIIGQYDKSLTVTRESGNYLFTGLFAERIFYRVREDLGPIAACGYAKLARTAFEEYGCPAKANSFLEICPDAFDQASPHRLSIMSSQLSLGFSTSETVVSPGVHRSPTNAFPPQTRQTSDLVLDKVLSTPRAILAAAQNARSQDITKMDLSAVIEIS